jgi:acetyl/propionyl-CoA carboxylase alpha subunit
VLEHPDFVAGRLDTGFIDRVLASGLMEEVQPSEEEDRVALLAVLLQVEQNGDAAPPRATSSNDWKRAGRLASFQGQPWRVGGRSW